MSKYICICGSTFNTKKQSELHMELRSGHTTIKICWKQRFWNWFFTYPWSRFLRFMGIFIIYFVICRHFKIDITLWEALLMGVGLGLAAA